VTDSGDHTTAHDRARRVLLGAGSGVLVIAVVVAVVGLLPGAGGGPSRPPVAAPATPTEVAPDRAARTPDEAPVGSSDVPVEGSVDRAESATPAAPAATLRPLEAADGPRSPTSWSEEVLAAEPGDEIRLTPQTADWTAERIVVGKDTDGRFLGRVTVRYSGPGSAGARFALVVLKQGEEIAVLTGELIEARAGVYQVLVRSSAGFVDGPWETRFQVLSTA
jgi:hypothetical protein